MRFDHAQKLQDFDYESLDVNGKQVVAFTADTQQQCSQLKVDLK